MTSFTTILFDVADNVATVTLNRPHVLNAFDPTMCDEFSRVWSIAREDDDIHCVVLRAAEGRAFCTGVDRLAEKAAVTNPWNKTDPGRKLGPKSNLVYKPVIVAVHGMCAGGAFYWLNEADIIICSPDATFFDPHVTYGMTSAFEPVGLARRIPYGEAARWALVGLDERMSAERAHGIGLVSEIVPRDSLWDRARQLATRIAEKPTVAVQGTTKALWEGVELTRSQMQSVAINFTQLGNPLSKTDLASTKRPDTWELR